MARWLAQQQMTLSDLEWPFHALQTISAVAELLVLVLCCQTVVLCYESQARLRIKRLHVLRACFCTTQQIVAVAWNCICSVHLFVIVALSQHAHLLPMARPAGCVIPAVHGWQAVGTTLDIRQLACSEQAENMTVRLRDNVNFQF